ncbi:hypothetical protein [Hyphomonas polymorpha]|nr:hypothetical protein [Hyphomonas polymorpha]
MKHLRYWPLFAFALLAACSPGPEETLAALPQDERMAVPETASDDLSKQEMAAQPASCADELGAEAAQVLVDQCLAISPATRPPCNAQNSCDMIRDEIRRGCGFGDEGGNPAFCSEYQ